MASSTFEAPKVYPVIHNEETDGVLRSVEQVLDAGADGVFLINHRNPATTLANNYHEVAKRFPGAFVGVNFLDIQDAGNVYEYIAPWEIPPAAVWADWYSLELSRMESIAYTVAVGRLVGRNTLLFAGVAHKAGFKNTNKPSASAAMTYQADPYVDYVTTTGTGTGIPAPVEKLSAMRSALSNAKLAVASGVTPENVGTYVPLVDAILIASSLELSFGDIDQQRLEDFMSTFKTAVEIERETRAATS